MVSFRAPRPFLKSILNIVLSVAAGAVISLLFHALHSPDPQTVPGKVGECVLFCLCAVGMAFAIAFCAAGIRDLLAGPSFWVNDKRFKVFGSRPVPLSELDRIETVFDEEGKTVKELKFHLVSGDIRSFSFTNTGVPLETVAYAIQIRKEKLLNDEKNKE